MKREKMEKRLRSMLDEDRYRHTLGVSETAVKMAEVFGEDAEKAELAGLLHDCAKCMPLSEMQSAAKEAHPDTEMMQSRALLHAAAGMCVARKTFEVDDPEVLGAIRWHTTGKSGMTRLEKIVYLADMIEPNRSPFPGLDVLRRLCFRDLDEAMHLALRMSTDHVIRQGKPLYGDTLAALRDYEPDALRDDKKNTEE